MRSLWVNPPFRFPFLCLNHLQIRYSSSQRRRIVVTGCGIVSPVGCSTEKAWKNVLNGCCGISKLTDGAYISMPCKIAAQVPEKELDLSNRFPKSELRTMSLATAYALIAGKCLSIFIFEERIKLKSNFLIYSQRSDPIFEIGSQKR